MIVSMAGLFGVGPQGKVHRACETASAAAGGSRRLAQGLFLDWRPLARDVVFFVGSLALCVFFALTVVTGDQYVGNADVECQTGYNAWEGMVLIVFYMVYIGVMVYNDAFMGCLKRCGGMPAHTQSYIDHSKRRKEAAQEKIDQRNDESKARARNADES
jgi:hypothetical protein